MALKAKVKTVSQMMAEGKALIREDAKREREKRIQEDFQTTMYTARTPPRSPWGV
jgi:hypothetical protein